MCNFDRFLRLHRCNTCQHWQPLPNSQEWGVCSGRRVPDWDGYGNPRDFHPPMPASGSCHLHTEA